MVPQQLHGASLHFVHVERSPQLTCGDLPLNFHPAAVRVSGFVRQVARVEQRTIGGAGRGCAADRPLR